MANARLEAAIQAARRRTNIETTPAIVANDGISPYPRSGYIRVQVKKGNDYLPAITVVNGLSFIADAGTPVELGDINGERGVVRADLRGIRAVGGNPQAVQRQERNAHHTDQSNIPVLKVVPQSPPSTALVALPAWLETPTGLIFFAGEVVSLATAIGNLSSGEHQLAGVFLTPSGAMEITTSTAKNSLDPLTTADIAECYAARTPGSRVGGFWRIADGMTEITADSEYLDARQFISLPAVPFSSADVSTPPTDAELDAIFGTPAQVGAGFAALLDDGGGDTNVYRVYSNGTSWFYSTLTKAT